VKKITDCILIFCSEEGSDQNCGLWMERAAPEINGAVARALQLPVC
jgi:hypothetical protein